MAISASIGVTYQMLLSSKGFYEYVLTPSKKNLFEKNKSGILSTIGYVSMYLSALAICLRVLKIYKK